MTVERTILLVSLIGLTMGCDRQERVLAQPFTSAQNDAATVKEQDQSIPVARPGEPCDLAGCLTGSCIHGVCSPLCIKDRDCGDPRFSCVQRGGGGRCSQICRSSEECAPGLICAVNRMMTGFCVAPGSGGGGDMCSHRWDCESWRCSNGRCLASCDTSGCGEKEMCLALHTQSVCTQIGEALQEAPCQVGGDCSTGICRGGRCSSACPDGNCFDDRVCVQFPALNLCERRCATSADCGDGAFCEASGDQRLCRTRGTGEDGSICAISTDCRSGRCEGRQCLRECGPEQPCSEGTVCVSSVSGSHCRTAGPAPIGARCRTSEQCATGFCAGGQCGRGCSQNESCGEEEHCVEFLEGAFCFAQCRTDTDCALGALCDGDLAERPVCYWRGSTDPLESCALHRDCRSGYCHNGLCASGCLDDTDCTSRMRCLSVGPRRICLAQPLPAMARCTNDGACADGLKCQGGRCLPMCNEGCPSGSTCVDQLCYPTCRQSSDCRGVNRCIPNVEGERACRSIGQRRAGESCLDSDQCQSGLCRDGACRAECPNCSDGEVCWTSPLGAWCLPRGNGDIGGMCASDQECASGLCIGRRCAGPCQDGMCPEFTHCTDSLGTRLCVGGCEPVAGSCSPAERCVREDGRWVCRRVGPNSSIGIECGNSMDCGFDSIGCIEGTDGLRCRQACRVDDPSACSAQDVCVAIDETLIGACAAVGERPLMASCQTSIDCSSGWCLGSYLGGRCLQRCVGPEDCNGNPCVDLAEIQLGRF